MPGASTIWRPPIPIALVVLLRIFQMLHNAAAIQFTVSHVFFVVVFVVTTVGLWRMRKWAAAIVLLFQAITTVNFVLSPELWRDKYPILGPAVSVIWFVFFTACILPYWRRMSWRL